MFSIAEQNRTLLVNAMKDRAFDAACDLLSQGGWSEFSMNRLAAKIGVAKGTLYNYFADKDTLIHFVLERLGTTLKKDLMETLAQSVNFLDSLEALVSKIADWMRRYSFMTSAFEQFYGATGSMAGRLNEWNELVVGQLRAVGLDVLKRGIELGYFRHIEPAEMWQLIYGSILGMKLTQPSGIDLGDPERLRAIMRLIIGGIGLPSRLREWGIDDSTLEQKTVVQPVSSRKK